MAESRHRDRAEMQLVADEHVKAVLEFMQENVPASKLYGVADSVPKMARLLWGEYEQEPVIPLVIGGSQPIASVSGPEQRRVGGDSAGAAASPAHQ
jgi:hypothetical protein